MGPAFLLDHRISLDSVGQGIWARPPGQDGVGSGDTEKSFRPVLSPTTTQHARETIFDIKLTTSLSRGFELFRGLERKDEGKEMKRYVGTRLWRYPSNQ